MAGLLEVKGLTKRFGGLVAVDTLTFDVNPGQIFSIIGPNGAGKTTVFNLITGVYEIDDGDLVFDGKSINGLKPNHIAKVGIARTFQAVRLFPAMTVIENVMVGQHVRSKAGLFGAVIRPPWTRQEEERIVKRSREILDFFGERLTPVRDSLASDLSYADRRRLEIARAMATEPKLLLLDEPTAGMNPVEKVGLVTLIGRLRDELGFTIILIEHDMPVVKGVSDHVVALDYGKVIAEGTYDEVASNERVIEAYLGKQKSGGAG